MAKRDYTLAYLRYATGQRPTKPNPASYDGVTPSRAKSVELRSDGH